MARGMAERDMWEGNLLDRLEALQERLGELERRAATGLFDDTTLILPGEIDVIGAILFGEKSTDPDAPDEGHAVIWMSDGTGKGDDGDVMIAATAGGVTRYATLFDHSAGAAW